MKASLLNDPSTLRLLDDALMPCTLGEGPLWDIKTQRLYWVDIEGCAIHRMDSVTDRHDVFPTPSRVGFAVLDKDGLLIAGLQDGLYSINPEDGTATSIVKPNSMPSDNRFNDGKCDRRGRLWCGTMNLNPGVDNRTGSLYRYDSRGLVQFETGIGISNGLGWSPDNKTMYYTDTTRMAIWQYDYDIDTGTPHNRRIFAEFEGNDRPDGLCVDSEGRILTALWPGWGVQILTPDGKRDGRIDLPVPQVSSCAFGGPDLKTLYITSACVGLTPDQIKEAPLSGSVFAIDLDIPGLPEHPFKETA